MANLRDGSLPRLWLIGSHIFYMMLSVSLSPAVNIAYRRSANEIAPLRLAEDIA